MRNIINWGEVEITSLIIFLPHWSLIDCNSPSRVSASISLDLSSLCRGHSEDWRASLITELLKQRLSHLFNTESETSWEGTVRGGEV